MVLFNTTATAVASGNFSLGIFMSLSDLVSYIQIETEAIKDANDKMMISSYCLSKLEMVNWYLELLEVGSKKYIVPQSKTHLEMVAQSWCTLLNSSSKVSQ